MAKQQLTDHELKHLIAETEKEIQRLETYREHLEHLFERAVRSMDETPPRKTVKKKVAKKIRKKSGV